MPRLCDLAERDIPNFNGIHYCHGDLDECCACLKDNRCVILGDDGILCGALAQNIETCCLTTLNHCPEIIKEIYDCVRNNKLHEAAIGQKKLCCRINECCRRGDDFVLTMKKEFNKAHSSIHVGPSRKPHVNVINREY